jgi:hypothetical protein
MRFPCRRAIVDPGSMKSLLRRRKGMSLDPLRTEKRGGGKPGSPPRNDGDRRSSSRPPLAIEADSVQGGCRHARWRSGRGVLTHRPSSERRFGFLSPSLSGNSIPIIERCHSDNSRRGYRVSRRSHFFRRGAGIGAAPASSAYRGRYPEVHLASGSGAVRFHAEREWPRRGGMPARPRAMSLPVRRACVSVVTLGQGKRGRVWVCQNVWRVLSSARSERGQADILVPKDRRRLG